MPLVTEEKFPAVIRDRFVKTGFCGASIGGGWLQIVLELDRKLSVLVPDYQIVQIKEKLGGLRFYIVGLDSTDRQKFDAVTNLIECAYGESDRTCEICGDAGTKVNRGGWIKTRCKKHEDYMLGGLDDE